MDAGDTFNFVELLRYAGRADEAAPIAAQVIEIFSADGEDNAPWIRMLEGDYEEALSLFIERAKDGRPPLAYTGVIKRYAALLRLPEFATLERLTDDWLKEQRAIYDQLTAARASGKDAAHP